MRSTGRACGEGGGPMQREGKATGRGRGMGVVARFGNFPAHLDAGPGSLRRA